MYLYQRGALGQQWVMLDVAIAQQNKALVFFYFLLSLCSAATASASAQRPEKCCFGRGEFEEHGKNYF